MNIRRFFSRQLDGDTAIIENEEFFHLSRVLRKGPGDKVILFNANGIDADALIVEVKKKYVVADIIKKRFTEKSEIRTVLCPSILKKRQMDIMIEKLTEMGIDEIRPVIFERTDARFRVEALKRWKKISIESLKVNDKKWPAEIFPPTDLPSIKKYAQGFNNRLLFDIQGKASAAKFKTPVIGVIGPPGDFSENERKNLTNAGFTPVNINDAVMRSETAAISAAAIIKFFSVN